MFDLRPIEEKDWAATWKIIKPVFRAGETYPYSPIITEEDAYQTWVVLPDATFVVVNSGDNITGTYYIKPNQAALGAHVCNCGYIVSDKARGKGIGSLMCEHSQREAVARGFLAMQFNLVVSTNSVSIHLWKKHGFEVVGTIPKAFRHANLGLVDAYVMYKQLV